jgi:hypothetical protein
VRIDAHGRRIKLQLEASLPQSLRNALGAVSNGGRLVYRQAMLRLPIADGIDSEPGCLG